MLRDETDLLVSLGVDSRTAVRVLARRHGMSTTVVRRLLTDEEEGQSSLIEVERSVALGGLVQRRASQGMSEPAAVQSVAKENRVKPACVRSAVATCRNLRSAGILR